VITAPMVAIMVCRAKLSLTRYSIFVYMKISIAHRLS
jgi:hypothetical protein